MEIMFLIVNTKVRVFALFFFIIIVKKNRDYG